MGMIQGSLNQLLQMGAIMGRLAPGYETKQELYKLGKREKVLSQAETDIRGMYDTPIMPEEVEKGTTRRGRELSNIYKEQGDISKKMFDVKPTVESYKRMLKDNPEWDTLPQDANDVAAQRAQQSLASEQSRLMRNRLLENAPKGKADLRAERDALANMWRGD